MAQQRRIGRTAVGGPAHDERPLPRRIMSDHATTAFGHLLKSHRLAAGLTQETLATRAGISARGIRELEHGETAPRRDTAQRLAQALGLSPEQNRTFAAAVLARPRRRRQAGSPTPPAVPTAARDALSTARVGRAAASVPTVPPNNLPAPLTHFIGRTQELATLARLLTHTRLLTLSGAAGVGKTRLALQLAQRVLESYAQGVWLVDLGPISDPALVPHKVAKALSLVENPTLPPLAALQEQLRPQHLLLLLDNCERLLDACAELAQTLLHGAPHLRILLTSREPLGLAGETVWIVPPLAIPEAPERLGLEQLARCESVQLFVDRARAAQPRFRLSAGNAAAVAQICCRLDGLPLALELAAARVRALGVAGVATHLDQQYVLLDVGSRTTVPRHRTLRAALDWSYDLLTEPEQRLVDRLSIFAGRFTLEAVEAVCTGAGIAQDGVLGMMLGVVDKSLVQIEDSHDTARYRLLDVVRQYGRERLAQRGETALIQGRHAAYYLALAERDRPVMPGRASVARLDRLEAELDNLRAALSWCLDDATASPAAVNAMELALPAGGPEMALRLAGALSDLWYWRGHRREGLQWLDRALARSPGAPTATRAAALLPAGSLDWVLGDRARGQERFRDAIAIYHGLGQSVELAFAYCLYGFWLRGLHYWLRGPEPIEPLPADYHEGTALMDEGLATIQRVGEPAYIAWARALCAESADLRDEHERANAWSKAQESLLAFQELGDPQGIGLTNHTLGVLALYERRYEHARAAFAAAVTAFRTLGDAAEMALDLAYLGYVAQMQGDHAAAIRQFDDSVALYRTFDFDRNVMSWILRNLGSLALEHGDAVRARTLYAEGLVRAQESGKPVSIASSLEALARLAAIDGQTQQAAELSATAAAIRETSGRPVQPAQRVTLRRAVTQARRALTAERQAAH